MTWVQMVVERLNRRVSDLMELAGVLLLAAALSYVHPALAVASAGVYLVVAANTRGGR